MSKENNNPIRLWRPQDGPDTWNPPEEFPAVSLKTIADLLDTTQSSARRWLKEAGVHPLSLGRGAKGAIRYH